MVKVAIIGPGYIAIDAHIPAYMNLGDRVELVAGVARSPEKCREKLKAFGIERIYTSAEEMLSVEHPDVVSVCTPNVSHVQMSKLALSMGADVLCEKPVALTYEDAKMLYDLADEKKRLLMSCQNTRFQPAWQRAKQFVAEGNLGEIYSADVKWLRRRGIPTWGSFTKKAENGGGALCDIGVHMLDAFFWLAETKGVDSITGRMGTQLKETLPVTAWSMKKGGNFRPEEMDVEEWAMGSLVTSEGIMTNFHFAWATNGPAEKTLLLNGTKGSLSVPELIFYPTEGDPIQLTCDENVGSHYSHKEMFRQFFAARETGAPLPVRPEETLLVTKVIDDFYQQQ